MLRLLAALLCLCASAHAVQAGFPGRMGPIAQPSYKLTSFIASVNATRAGISNTIIACLGDSTTAGSSAFSLGSYAGARPVAFPAILASLLNASTVSATASSVNGTQNITVATYQPYNTETSFTTIANWAGNAATFGGGLFRTTTSNSRMLWTPSIPVDTFEVHSLKISTSGFVSAYLDGSTSATTTFDLLQGGGPATLDKQVITTSLGTHSIEIAKISGTEYNLSQLIAYNSAKKQVLVYNGGVSGATAANAATTTNLYSSLPMLAALKPNLTIIDIGLNDFDAGTTQTSFEASLTAMVTYARLSGDALLVFPNSRGSVNEATFLGYYKNVATRLKVPMINLQDTLGTLAQATANGDMNTDNLHPTAQGYAKIGRAIYNRISQGL